ncbi:endonuclease NucS domain-containing protein [Streptomyces sp. NPDC087425]|uniref:endonuclease NucS domain-containing protein n=1 Tax=Streptomyces sp. NPDC087425 TaxID=3365787 RepID=UPI003826155F
MNEKYESVLRDQLAQNLTLIEPGLSLIGTEFHLRNPHGARGYVDILARDGLGKVVIIELKRSESTARQAIHELFKYATLIRLEHGLGIEQVRCLLVSTVWSELLLPFSEFVRNVAYAVEGKRLALDSDGNVSDIQPVLLVADSTYARLLPWHNIYLYGQGDDRDSDVLKLANGLQRAGVSDYVLAVLKQADTSSGVIYRNAIYAAISTYFSDGRPLVAYESPEYEEYDSLIHEAGNLVHPNDIEIGYPDKFRQILRSWDVERVIRGGRFSSSLLWPDEGLLGLILSEDGEHAAWLEATASPRHAPSWKKFRANVVSFLDGNYRWSRGLDCVFEAVQANESATVSLEIFNPRDVIAAIGRAVRHRDTRAFPCLELVVDSERGARVFKGFVCWDGVTCPVDPNLTIDDVLPDGLEAYPDLSHFDAIGMFDAELMKCHGLSYELFEASAGRLTRRLDPATSTWVENGDSQMSNFLPVANFLLANREYARKLEGLTGPVFEVY